MTQSEILMVSNAGQQSIDWTPTAKENAMRTLFRISALAALALGALAVSAQAQEKTVGLVAGVGLSTMTGNDLSDGTKTRVGFTGGIFVDIPVGGGNVAIEPEVLYSSKGAKYDNEFYTGSYVFDYIEVPVLFKWSQQPSGDGFSLFAGPAVNFNISCKDKGHDNTFDEDYDEDCSAYDASPNTVISGVVGAGYSKGRAGIEVRYDFDLGDALKDDTSDENYDAKNQVWQILVRVTK